MALSYVRLDGTLVARFPKLAIFLEPRREVAKRAAATRKVNAAAKQSAPAADDHA